MDYFSITWKIENFTLCVNKKDDCIRSSCFVTHSLGNTEWCLRMYPYGDGANTHVSCYLTRSDTDDFGQSSIAINFSFSFVLADGSEHLIKTFENIVFNPSYRHGCVALERRQDILKEKNNYLPKGTLTIRCYMQSCRSVSSTSQRSAAVKSLACYLYNEKSEASSLYPEIYNEADKILKNVQKKFCPYPESCTVTTKIRVERKSLIWRLENFTDLKKHERVSLAVMSATKFRPSLLLTFYLGADEHIQIEIRLKENIRTRIVLKCQISLLNDKDKICDFSDSQYFFETQKKFGSDQVWKFPWTIKKSKLISDKTSYLNNDTLSLLCEFAMSDGKTLIQIEETIYSSTKLENKNESMESVKMRRDFSALMAEAKLYDVRLIVEKSVIPAHKAVLSARSLVFKAMFESDMAEKENGIVNVDDLDADTLTRLMTYMYGGTQADLQYGSATKLYSAADKYQCLGLKDFCCNFLKENMSVANVCDVLILADMHQDKELTALAHEFVLRHVPETLRSEEWKTFMKIKTQLAGETLHSICLYMHN